MAPSPVNGEIAPIRTTSSFLPQADRKNNGTKAVVSKRRCQSGMEPPKNFDFITLAPHLASWQLAAAGIMRDITLVEGADATPTERYSHDWAPVVAHRPH